MDPYWYRWYVVVSKSLLFLLLMVTLLTAGASLQSGALRSESGDARNEIHASVRSFQSDAKTVYRRIQDVPLSLHAAWGDFLADWRELKADASAQARDVARKLSAFVGNKPHNLS